MNKKELRLILEEGEGLTVEFKERYTSNIDQDIVAFANTRGGVILLGVNDEEKVTGERLTNKLKAEITDLARNCEPAIDVSIKQVDNVIVVNVKEGDEKPYSCSSGYFRRLDAVTQKMSQKEIKIMFQNISVIPFEERINKDIAWNNISRDKIFAFLKEAGINLKKVTPQNVLGSLNLSKNNCIKNAGVLFFAREPRKLILQAQMALIAFKGKDRIHIYDRIDIQDDLLTQFNEAILFLKKHLNVRSEIKGVNRKDIYEIPLEALREGVANAVIHRDYSMRGTSLMVEVYDDRVEITNPGGLPQGLSLSSLGKISIRRNELIADMFSRMDKAERVGTGIKRMQEAMEKAGLSYPEIQSNSFFTITFRRPIQIIVEETISEHIGKHINELLNEPINEPIKKRLITELLYIQNNHFITIEIIKKGLNISRATARRDLSILKKSGILKFEGARKTGRYVLTEKGGKMTDEYKKRL